MSASPDHPRRILGVDPGLGATGWAVLEDDYSAPPTWALTAHGLWCFKHDEDFCRGQLYAEALTEVIGTRRVEAVALEGQFATMPGKDVSDDRARSMARQAQRVTLLRGQLMAAAAQAGVRASRIVVIPPATAKKRLTGSGRAEKSDMLVAVRRLYNVALLRKHDHVADAVAIGLAGGDKLVASGLW